MDKNEWKSALSMIPKVASKDVDNSLNVACRKLATKKRDDLCVKLTAALHNYVVDHLIQAQRVPPSKLRPLLKQAVNSADALCTTGGITPLLAKTAASLSALANRELAVQERRVAQSMKRTKPGKHRAGRHDGDKPLQQFFGTLNDIWDDCFNELPGGSKDGPFLRFAAGMLHSYAATIPDEIEHLAPGLRARLRLGPQAIQGRFRRTKISGIQRIAKSS